jgi:hypothetical protein
MWFYGTSKHLKGVLAMKERVNKIKNWCKEHKGDVRTVLLTAGGVAVGYFAGKKVAGNIYSIGAMRCYDKGLMQFVNPKTGAKITVAEALELAKTMEW